MHNHLHSEGITAVMVTHYSAHVVVHALQALLKQPLIKAIIVVDNASTDETTTLVRANFSTVQLITNTSNVGFAIANNQALAMVKTRYALLINPDAMLGEAALETLHCAAQQYPDAALLGPTLVMASGKAYPWYARDVLSVRTGTVPWLAIDAVRGLDIYPQGDCCVDWLPSTVWLLRMEYCNRLGGFDTNIFLFYEDEDFCIRARRAGLSCVSVPTARATHARGTSSGLVTVTERWRQKQMAWSRLYIERKYYNPIAAQQLGFAQLRYYVLKTIHSALNMDGRKIAYYLGRVQGVASFLRGADARQCAFGRLTNLEGM